MRNNKSFFDFFGKDDNVPKKDVQRQESIGIPVLGTCRFPEYFTFELVYRSSSINDGGFGTEFRNRMGLLGLSLEQIEHVFREGKKRLRASADQENEDRLSEYRGRCIWHQLRWIEKGRVTVEDGENEKKGVLFPARENLTPSEHIIITHEAILAYDSDRELRNLEMEEKEAVFRILPFKRGSQIVETPYGEYALGLKEFFDRVGITDKQRKAFAINEYLIWANTTMSNEYIGRNAPFPRSIVWTPFTVNDLLTPPPVRRPSNAEIAKYSK